MREKAWPLPQYLDQGLLVRRFKSNRALEAQTSPPSNHPFSFFLFLFSQIKANWLHFCDGVLTGAQTFTSMDSVTNQNKEQFVLGSSHSQVQHSCSVSEQRIFQDEGSGVNEGGCGGGGVGGVVCVCSLWGGVGM